MELQDISGASEFEGNRAEVVDWCNAVAKYLSAHSTAVSLFEICDAIPFPQVPLKYSLMDILANDSLHRFAVSGEGQSARVRRIYRVDDEEISEGVEEWRNLLVQFLSAQATLCGLSDIGSAVIRPPSVPNSIKLLDVLKCDPLQRFLIVGEGNNIRAKLNFILNDEQMASVIDQWRDNISRFLSTTWTTVSLVDIDAHVIRPIFLPDSVSLADVLSTDPAGRFAVSGDEGNGSTIPNTLRARRIFHVDDPEISVYVDTWRVEISRFLATQYSAVSLSDIGSSIPRPQQLPTSVKLIDVMKADPLNRFILSGDGNNIRAAVTTTTRSALIEEFEMMDGLSGTRNSHYYGASSRYEGPYSSPSPHSVPPFSAPSSPFPQSSRPQHPSSASFERSFGLPVFDPAGREYSHPSSAMQKIIPASPGAGLLSAAAAAAQYRDLNSRRFGSNPGNMLAAPNLRTTTALSNSYGAKFAFAGGMNSVNLPLSGRPPVARINAYACEPSFSSSSIVSPTAKPFYPSQMSSSSSSSANQSKEALKREATPIGLIPSGNSEVNKFVTRVPDSDLSPRSEFINCFTSAKTDPLKESFYGPFGLESSLTRCDSTSSIGPGVFTSSSGYTSSSNSSRASLFGGLPSNGPNYGSREDELDAGFGSLSLSGSAVSGKMSFGQSNAFSMDPSMSSGIVLSSDPVYVPDARSGMNSISLLDSGPPPGLSHGNPGFKGMGISIPSSSSTSSATSPASTQSQSFTFTYSHPSVIGSRYYGEKHRSESVITDSGSPSDNDESDFLDRVELTLPLSVSSKNWSQSQSRSAGSSSVTSATVCSSLSGTSSCSTALSQWIPTLFQGHDPLVISSFVSRLRDEGFVYIDDLLEAYRQGQLSFESLQRLAGFKTGHYNRLVKALAALDEMPTSVIF